MNTIKSAGLALALIGVLLLAGCTSNQGNGDVTTTVPQKETLAIAGSTTVQPIASRAAEEYMKINKNIVVSVAGGGSGAGIKMVKEASADIGTSSRELTSDEINTDPKLVPTAIANDGVAIIVHPSNTVTELSKEQIRGIFAGNITNYKQLGGPDKEIVVIIRESGSGTRTSFEDIVMNKAPNAASAEQQSSNGAVKATVASNPNAIGYVGAGFIDDSVKALPVGGVKPTTETIKSATYPISRKLFMVTRGEPTGKEKAFIDYVLSPAGQNIVEEEGFVKL